MSEPVMSGKCTRRGTVLVVDDDQRLTRAISRLLRAMELEVLVATGSQEAVEICRARGNEIDAVLLDLYLQGKKSMETLRQMRSLHPGVKVILMSGYGRQESVDNFAGMRLDGFLLKPFGFTELESTIRAAIALPSNAAG
jgi:two-component system, cell cycle sensor histidine kinase and response regulator CckA